MQIVQDMPPRVDLRLPPDAQAPSEARRSLERVAGDLDEEALETLRLLVSELVTNSVRHADLDSTQWIALRVESSPRSIRVAVRDPGIGFRWPEGPPPPGNPHGWGLYLVEQMADRWGVDDEPETQVWFEIDRTSAA